MPPILTAFAASPDRGRGMARDMRVRWALEEVGKPYEVRLLSFAEMKAPAHLARQPFGQIPTFEESDLVLFETGAIVLHIAGQHPGLLPAEPKARARAISWMFAALNSVEPVLLELETAGFEERGKTWLGEHLTMIETRIGQRLGRLSARLGRAEWLDGAFSAGDLMMVGVLYRFRSVLDPFPNLAAYVQRDSVRPAFQRAFAAQLAVYQAGQAEGE